jgi:hypothetical protein
MVRIRCLHIGACIWRAKPITRGFVRREPWVAGEEQPDDGQVSVDPSMTIGYFSQDVEPPPVRAGWMK